MAMRTIRLFLLLLLGRIMLPLDVTVTVTGLAPVVANPTVLSAALGMVLALSSPTAIPPESQTFDTSDNVQVPILEVVKVYGKLAGSECYGKQAPQGSSCQIDVQDLWEQFVLRDSGNKGNAPLSRDDFASALERMEFAWPLKPFGIDQSPSLAKTAVMNKGAETMVYLHELEARGLYDPRNPTGPLPTSLRPALNRQLQAEGLLDPRAVDMAYHALVAPTSPSGILVDTKSGPETETNTFPRFLDYYEFLKLVGPNSISWPNY